MTERDDMVTKHETQMAYVCLELSAIKKGQKELISMLDTRCESRLNLINNIDDKIIDRQAMTTILVVLVGVIITLY